jgi:hypothetical protein
MVKHKHERKKTKVLELNPDNPVVIDKRDWYLRVHENCDRRFTIYTKTHVGEMEFILEIRGYHALPGRTPQPIWYSHGQRLPEVIQPLINRIVNAYEKSL